ncbi:MAG TPA: FtsX-like permease family protein, partial [Gemmatimonadaceae bacterium]|nr:FtsX-like permease family protein [Gemmatimonadaceae bacterium]
AFRSKEVGIRTALGASRSAVILQFLTESFLLSAVGAALGVGIAVVGVRLFNDSLTSTNPPFWIDIKVDPAVVLFVLATSILATLISGLVPAVQASRVDINEILKDETRGSSSFRLGRMSKALVVFEMALSCGLLVAAGLTIKSVTKLRHIDFGFPVDDVFTARVGLFEATFPSDTARIQFAERLAERAAALPGANEVAVTSSLPGLGFGRSTFAREGATYQKEQDYPRARVVTVSPGFFPLVRARAIEGRLLGDGDRMGALPVAVVNERFARKFFKGESPVGQRVRIGGDDTTQAWRTIVGVVPDRRAGEVDDDDAEGIYVPVGQNALRFMSVMVRTRGDPSTVAGPLRDAVQALDRDTPIYFAWSMREAIARPTWFYRVFGTIFMIFGVVALFLAGVGLYGVMAFSVSRRTREVGVRMALGAQGRDVVSLIFRQGLGQIAVGMLFGLALAAGLSRFLQLILFDVRPRDPAIFTGVVLVLTAVGALACLVPARRATRVDPMVALRAE